jgi:hypothetical protein
MAMIFVDQILFDDDAEENDLEEQLLASITSETFTQELLSVITSNTLAALAGHKNPRKRNILDMEGGDDDGNGDSERRVTTRRLSRWDWDRARLAIWKDYMSPTPVFDDRQFDQMFCITRTVMQELRVILGKNDKFFTESICCVTRKKTISPDAKILFALKQLAYGTSPHAFVDYFQMGETTARKCLIKFAKCVNGSQELKQRFFRPMTRADAKNACTLHKERHGINGMVGSLDCMHVSWKNCPVAWQGQFQGKEAYPSIVLEAVCDYNLYFWHHEFGSAGTLNDITIWDLSGLHKTFVDGSWAENVDFEYMIDGQTFDKLWVTVDGIYPQIARFVKTLSQPMGRKQENYAKWQERTRKDIERAFGVLQSKFRWLVQRIELWKFDDIVSVVNCCILLHNWMVTIRLQRDEVECNDWYDVPVDDGGDTDNGGDAADGGTTNDGGDAADGGNAEDNSNGDDGGNTDNGNGDDGGNTDNGGNAATGNDGGNLTSIVGGINRNRMSDRMMEQQYLVSQARHRKEHTNMDMQMARQEMLEKRWHDLYDVENFYRLQQAIYNELETINWNFDN